MMMKMMGHMRRILIMVWKMEYWGKVNNIQCGPMILYKKMTIRSVFRQKIISSDLQSKSVQP